MSHCDNIYNDVLDPILFLYLILKKKDYPHESDVSVGRSSCQFTDISLVRGSNITTGPSPSPW